MNLMRAGIVAAGILVGVILLRIVIWGVPYAPSPIVSGKLINVMVWERPVQRPGELGSNGGNRMKDGQVDVYDHFILVTSPDGKKTLSLHGWYTDLQFETR